MIYSKEDILRIRGELGMTQEEFAEKLDISRQWLIKLEKGDKTIGPHQVALIDKLMHEKGKLSLQSSSSRVPFYDVEAMAGRDVTADMMPVTEPTGTIDVGDLLRDSEFAIRIYGNSMIPNYPSGCVVGLQSMKDGIVEYGNVYVIETEDNRYLKRLLKDPEGLGWMCYSDNVMKFSDGPRTGQYCYEPFVIPFEKVKRMYRVTGSIKRNLNSTIF